MDKILITALLGSTVRNPWPRGVRHVALCGWPKCGKTTIAEMLEDEFGGVVIDDGMILREALPILLGIDPKSCFTQEGKSRKIKIGNRDETVREGLGELGNYLEARYGPDIMPIRAMQIAEQQHSHAPFFIYPSVRKTQGRCYKRHGGIVVEINNPAVSDSGNQFDAWDSSCVDFVVPNDPRETSLSDLREWVCSFPDFINPIA